ncbi:DUF5685 family protein [Mycobacterium sp.]|uniref:DUF5685 family protein n=1 Tax=Mycobacterium sp. TaxID=1785 RepID=UPI003F9E7ABF
MFGIIRPCRHQLGGELAAAWTARLCGLCLALRDDYDQSARIATNYDGLVVSLLVEAQSALQPTRRVAGPCPLRGMRRADVATGQCVRLTAVVSLALAAAQVRDHVDDRDGVIGALGVRPARAASPSGGCARAPTPVTPWASTPVSWWPRWTGRPNSKRQRVRAARCSR